MHPSRRIAPATKRALGPGLCPRVRRYRVRKAAAMTNDWPRVYDQAQAEIRDLRSQLGALERSATQIEDLKTKLETARGQLEAAGAGYAEAAKDNCRLRPLLEAAQEDGGGGKG